MSKRSTTPNSDRGNCISGQSSPAKATSPLPPAQTPHPAQPSTTTKPKSQATAATAPTKSHPKSSGTPPPLASGSGTAPSKSTQAAAAVGDPAEIGAGTQEVEFNLTKDDMSELLEAKSIKGTEDLKKEKRKEPSPSTGGFMNERRGILVRLSPPLPLKNTFLGLTER